MHVIFKFLVFVYRFFTHSVHQRFHFMYRSKPHSRNSRSIILCLYTVCIISVYFKVRTYNIVNIPIDSHAHASAHTHTHAQTPSRTHTHPRKHSHITYAGSYMQGLQYKRPIGRNKSIPILYKYSVLIFSKFKYRISITQHCWSQFVYTYNTLYTYRLLYPTSKSIGCF